MSHHQRRRRRLLIRLAELQDNLCFHCGESMRLPDPDASYGNGELNAEDYASYDHLHPRIKGGKGGFNLVISHRGCNSKKGDRPPTFEEMEKLESLNETRKHLITPEHGIISPASFGEVTSATIVLAEVLNNLEGEDSNKHCHVVCRFLAIFYRDIKALDAIENIDNWERIVKLIECVHRTKLYSDESSILQNLRNFVANVINSIIRNRRLRRRAECKELEIAVDV